MRWQLLAAMLVAACAQPPVVNCLCANLPTEKVLVDGAFIHTIDEFEVTEGTYRAPSFGSSTPTELHFDENLLRGTLGDAVFAVRVRVHVDVRHTDAPATGCCSAVWGDLEPTAPQPEAWQERNAAVMDWTDVGDVLARLDPSAHFEPTLPPLTEDGLPAFTMDTDLQGFVVHAWYLAQPAGCTDASCTSMVRVQHHFRRP